MKRACFLFAVVLMLCLCACSGGASAPAEASVPLAVPETTPAPLITLSSGSFSADVEELYLEQTAEDFPLLEGFSCLRRIVFTGEGCLDEILAFYEAHPEIKISYKVTLPTACAVDCSATSLDLHENTKAEILACTDYFKYLPSLCRLRLPDIDSDSEFSFEDCAALHEAYPELVLSFGFELYGRSFHSLDETIELRGVKVEDKGEAARLALRCMPGCRTLDMDSCGVENEDMAAIRDEFPDVKVIWRVWFGENYCVRTDVEKILASKPSVGGNILPSNSAGLKYCTEVKYLDLGHNEALKDISFISYMPKLEVLVIAMAGVEDASPLKDLKNLEYLEIQSNPKLADLSPLAGLTSLHHLNIGCLPLVEDLTPIYNLTNLERLTITRLTPIPSEQVEEFEALVPGCIVDTRYEDPTAGKWRYTGELDKNDQPVLHPRYELLCEQMGYLSFDYCFCWRDPIYLSIVS